MNKLSFGVWDPSEIPIIRVVQSSWAKWMKAESDGRIETTSKYFESIVRISKLPDAMASGLCYVGWSILDSLSRCYRLIEVITVPHLYKSPVSLTPKLTVMEINAKYGDRFTGKWERIRTLNYHSTYYQT